MTVDTDAITVFYCPKCNLDSPVRLAKKNQTGNNKEVTLKCDNPNCDYSRKTLWQTVYKEILKLGRYKK